MARIDWARAGDRYFEAGIDRGVLYVDNNPGVPWVGLVSFNQSQAGGEPVARYLDGIKISNRTTPEEFEGTLEAYTYPVEFERCDGTHRADNGLRITQQRRRPFHMSYRSQIGNDVAGLSKGYKIHIMYNLKAQPSDKGYRTLVEQNEPLTFNWKVTSRAAAILDHRPCAHFIVDSRDVPSELLTQLEDILYGTDITDASIPSPGELLFLFDSYLDLIYDAGTPFTPVFVTYDAGSPSTPVDATIDGGAL
jgi:hypothetical protein